EIDIGEALDEGERFVEEMAGAGDRPTEPRARARIRDSGHGAPICRAGEQLPQPCRLAGADPVEGDGARREKAREGAVDEAVAGERHGIERPWRRCRFDEGEAPGAEA